MKTSHVIVGTRYNLRPGTYVNVGDKIQLILEPSNEYDSNAIAIYLRDDKIGYIKASEAILLSQYLDDQNIETTSFIESITSNCKITIIVYYSEIKIGKPLSNLVKSNS